VGVSTPLNSLHLLSFSEGRASVAKNGNFTAARHTCCTSVWPPFGLVQTGESDMSVLTVPTRRSVGGSPVPAMTEHGESRSQDEADDLLHAALPLVDAVVAAAAWRHRLQPDQAEDLAGDVRLRLLADDRALLRNYRGNASLRTYLTVVVRRMILDRKVAAWGRWRPCAEARRSGRVGVLLDQLLNRDGISFDHACALLREQYDVTVSRQHLVQLEGRLKSRTPRRMVPLTDAEDVAEAPCPARVYEDAEARRASCGRAHLVRAAIGSLPASDRKLLSLRYRHGLSIATISQVLEADQRQLYRRFDRLLRDLRRDVAQRHLDSTLRARGSRVA
jgi:RNA polymerase sigma factor (sigma-70 family)